MKKITLAFLSVFFVSHQGMATHLEVEKETKIKVHFTNPTNVLLEGNALPEDQIHPFETPAGSLRVEINMLGEGQASHLIHSFVLDSNNDKVIDISKLVAPVELAIDKLVFQAHLVSNGLKVAAGASSLASCSKVSFGSDVVFSLKKLEDEQYMLECHSTHP